MKTKLTKLISILLCGALLVTAVPFSAMADEPEPTEYTDTDDFGFEPYQEVEEEKVSSVSLINDPSYNGMEEPEELAPVQIHLPGDAGIQTVGDTTESTDWNYAMDSLPATPLVHEQSSGNLKSLFPQDDIYQYYSDVLENNQYINNHLYNGENTRVFMQGGCTDGQYYYFMFNVDNGKTKKETIGCFVVRAIMDDDGAFSIDGCRTCVDQFEEGSSYTYNEYKNLYNEGLFKIGHANSMTYNSSDNTIVIATTNNDKSEVCTVNVDYFRGTSDSFNCNTYNVSCRFTTIAYNDTTNRYVVNVSGNHDCFCILDSDFNIVETYIRRGQPKDNGNEGHQGLFCDDTYIYSLFKASDSDGTIRNVMGIYKWDGTLVKEINLNFNPQIHNGTKDVYEGENLIFTGNKVIMGMNCNYWVNSQDELRHFYYYDLSSRFFHIQYCIDDNVQARMNDANKIFSNVVRNTEGVTTKIKKNTFTKTGYKFAGWTLYRPLYDKWSYKNSDGTIVWYREGEQPSGFSKSIYADKASVSQTVQGGETVLFCAQWTATDKFYVSFDANGGSGSMTSQTVTYNTNTTVKANTFTKSGCTFQGWYIFNPQTTKWLYCDPNDTSVTQWRKEGQQTAGYIKRTYQNKTTIARTVPAGQNVVFVAAWSEFYVMFDSGGVAVGINQIQMPIRAKYGTSNSIYRYVVNSVTCSGYHLHRLEDDKWKYDNGTTRKFYKLNHQPSGYYLFMHTATSVNTTVAIGKHVVFEAQW